MKFVTLDFRFRFLLPLLAAALLVGFSAPQLQAQAVSTSITGIVTDPTGAVIPGAELTATRVETGDVYTTASNERGNYTFPVLEPGTYTVSCSVPGFKTEVQSGIVLQLQQRARIDFEMEIGEQVETVEVTGATPLLRTEDATLGSVIERKRVVDLPLNGRNFAQLATLMPGVVFGISRMGLDGQGGFPIDGETVSISAQGQRDIQQHATVDGVVAVEPRVNTMTFTPSIEAIAEFKVQSGVYGAEYGMNSGAQINVQLRSGTNELHGTLFEFIRNDTLDARGFFLPADQKKNKLRRNQYGAVVSGPIVRNRTFWMFDFEARNERRATPSQTTTPTLAMRDGDFSEILQPGNRWYPSDPNPMTNRRIFAPGSDSAFPNNQIPMSMFDPTTLATMTQSEGSPFSQGGFLPFPNQDALARSNNSTVNLAGVSNNSINTYQYLTRIDHRVSDNDRLFGHFVLADREQDSLPLQQINQLTTINDVYHIAFGWTKIVTPTIVNDFRYGYNRSDDIIANPWTNTDFTQRSLGWDFRVVGDGNRELLPLEEGPPNIAISGFNGIPIPSTGGWFNEHIVNEFSDNVVITRGTHNFKFGGVYRHNFVDRGAANWPRGRTQFTRDIQGIPDAMAAFVLGFPNSANTSEGIPPLFARQHKWAMYFQDDWKATPRLTINYGVRWDFFGHIIDDDGRFRNVSFEDGQAQIFPRDQVRQQIISNLGSTPVPAPLGIDADVYGMHERDASGGVFVPMLWPDPQVEANLNDVPWTQIMPRLGIAYRLTDNWVMRIGAGHFYNAQQINNFSILNLTPPFSGSKRFENDRGNPTSAGPFVGAPNPGVSPDALLMLGNIIADRGNRSLFLNNDIWQWSFQLERSITDTLKGTIGYVGSASSNLDMPWGNFNSPDPGPGDVQYRRPFPFYVDSTDPSTLIPMSTVRRLDPSVSWNYNALQGSLEQRMSKGLLFQASFNYQKGLGVGYGANEGAGFGGRRVQNPRDRDNDYGRNNIDQRFRFVFSHIYEIPWMQNATGLKGALLGGWAVNGIMQLTSGLPVTVTQSGNTQNVGGRNFLRPHLLGGNIERVADNRSLEQWFPTENFLRSTFEGDIGPERLFVPGTLGYGTSGIGLFDAPAQKTWDFALFKVFRINENQNIQFRWEAFNFLNTPQFSAPNRSVGSSNFGRITSTITGNRSMQFALKYNF